MLRGWRFGIVVIGLCVQLVGLTLDAWLHARDATLAAREGVFTLSNPGHALFAIGLALVVLGVSLMLIARIAENWTARADGGGAGSRRAVVLPAVGVLMALALAGGALRLGTLDSGHAHEHTDMAHDHGGQEHDSIRISWERLQEINRMLAEAKAAVEKYQDVNLARADGYRQETPDVIVAEGIHFIHPGLLAANTFDLTRPPYLIYENSPGGGLKLAGVGWALPRQPGDWTVPPSPFGPLGFWHTHGFSDICIRTRGAIEEALMNIYPEECAAAGGTYIAEHPWILHAWLFTPSPEGVFGHINSAITGLDPLD